jgi:hypothetical protein
MSIDGDQTQAVSLFERMSERYEKAAYGKLSIFIPLQ